jgi:hypothetical protein
MVARREASEEPDVPRHEATITLPEKVQSGQDGVRLGSNRR